MVEGKECSRCGEWKPRTGFYKEKLGKHGLRSRCISCMGELEQQRRREDHEGVLKREQEWRDANRETLRVRQQRWAEENRDQVRENARRWAEENREHLSEWRRDRYANDPHYFNKARDDAHKRRARERSLSTETINRWELFDRDRWTCGICDTGIPIVVRHPHPLSASVDHIIPISHEACPGHVWTNVQASHLVCNLRKLNKYDP